jgi:hypothetical protein
MDPILRCLPNESTLVTSGRGIALNGMTASPDEIMEPGEFNNDSIVVILIERSFLEVLLDEGGLQGSVCSFL